MCNQFLLHVDVSGIGNATNNVKLHEYSGSIREICEYLLRYSPLMRTFASVQLGYSRWQRGDAFLREYQGDFSSLVEPAKYVDVGSGAFYKVST